MNDERINEPGLLTQHGPNCWNSSSCCDESELESKFLLDLDLGQGQCPQYTFSVRCYNILEMTRSTLNVLKDKLRNLNMTKELASMKNQNQYFDLVLLSEWSDPIRSNFTCKKVLGLGHMTAVGIAVSVVTAVIALIFIFFLLYICRFVLYKNSQ